MSRVDGYTTDITFPAFFYKEMQPVWISHLLRFEGFQAPDLAGHFRLCELGCGVGVNLLVAAACHPAAQFIGVDFNPQHLEIARTLAQAAGLHNLEFVQADFAQFAASQPQAFDFINTHGVWSWIAPGHQQAMLEVVRQSLKVGGVFYLHYMCHPGSTDLQTLQHFLNVFAPHVPGSSSQQVQMGLKLLQQLAQRGMFADQPNVLRHLEQLQRKDATHLAHEFLTDHWQPQHGVDVHRQVGSTGLQYVCSADVFNNLDVSLSIPGRLQNVVAQTKIAAVAETLKDMARNSHQRMDLFQRAPQVCSVQEQLQDIQKMGFQLLPNAPKSGAIDFTTPMGNVQGPEALCSPLLGALHQGPQTFAALMQLPPFHDNPALLLQSLQLMMMQSLVHPVNPVASPSLPAVPLLHAALQQQAWGITVMPEMGTATLRRP
ncbi:MAG: methyltransferase domain-containing protein [Comamonas sp.]|nr:methyltransferase domain-containing protein [Comamonas sp.]